MARVVPVALPDDLRTEKQLWQEIVDAQLPDVALATRVAIPSLSDFVSDPLVLAFRAFVATRMHVLLRAGAATQPAKFEPAINA